MTTPRSVKLHQRGLSLPDDLVKVVRGKGNDVGRTRGCHEGCGENGEERYQARRLHVVGYC